MTQVLQMQCTAYAEACRNCQMYCAVRLLKVGEKRLSLVRHPFQSVNTENRVGPPTPCASPELMRHSKLSHFPKPNAQSPGEVFLAIFHSGHLH